MSLSGAERQARYLARLKAGIAPPRAARRGQDRRSKPQQWVDALTVLEALLDGWQVAREALPDSLNAAPYAQRLDAVLALREHLEALQAAADELPLGFGRD